MGLTSLGGSKSTTRSSSKSSSYDNMDSFGFNFGASSANQRVAFEDVFAQLFGNASAAAGSVNTGALTNSANMLFGAGGNFLNSLTGGGPGQAYLEGQLANSDNIANEQIDQLGADIGKFLANEVNPNITAGGISANTFGGSRGEVQRGLASEAALQQFARGATSIRAGERERMSGIASGLMGNNLQASQIGLSALPQLFGIAEGGAMASLSPLLALSRILGPMTALSSSQSLDMGMDSATGRAGSSSSSSSVTKSKSFNAGF